MTIIIETFRDSYRTVPLLHQKMKFDVWLLLNSSTIFAKHLLNISFLKMDWKDKIRSFIKTTLFLEEADHIQPGCAYIELGDITNSLISYFHFAPYQTNSDACKNYKFSISYRLYGSCILSNIKHGCEFLALHKFQVYYFASYIRMY